MVSGVEGEEVEEEGAQAVRRQTSQPVWDHEQNQKRAVKYAVCGVRTKSEGGVPDCKQSVHYSLHGEKNVDLETECQ